MFKNFSQNVLNWVAKNFKNDPGKMLIITGAVGWAASSLAQIGAVLFNSKISDKEKSFLVPQELADAFWNIGLFIAFTTVLKKGTAKLFETGKIAPKAVREFLNKNAHLYADKVGKLGFNLDNVLKEGTDPHKAYNIYKSFGTTAATVGGGILATNIFTPVLRNSMASKMQKNFVAFNQAEQKPVINPQAQYPMSSYRMYGTDMRI